MNWVLFIRLTFFFLFFSLNSTFMMMAKVPMSLDISRFQVCSNWLSDPCSNWLLTFRTSGVKNVSVQFVCLLKTMVAPSPRLLSDFTLPSVGREWPYTYTPWTPPDCRFVASNSQHYPVPASITTCPLPQDFVDQKQGVGRTLILGK